MHGSPGANRRGGVLILAMVCLTLIVVILGSLLKMSMAEHKQKQRDELALEADWLAESACERAFAYASADAKYVGEEWTVVPQTPGDERTGRAVIKVETVAGRPAERTVTVAATFPANAEIFVRRSKQLTVRRNVTPQE